MPEWERTVRDIFEEKGAGRMRLLRARNPWVFSALEDLCSYCGIPLRRTPCPEIDALRAAMFGMMQQF